MLVNIFSNVFYVDAHIHKGLLGKGFGPSENRGWHHETDEMLGCAHGILVVALEDAKRLDDALHQIKQCGGRQNHIFVNRAQHRAQLYHRSFGAQHKH
jgi:hypothetical protein